LTILNIISGGVILARFDGAEKKSQASPIEPGMHCLKVRVLSPIIVNGIVLSFSAITVRRDKK